ncbi:S1 family peptidase [Amycolatopsis anabasis]|uniref:S1 family peptidase n=1 Tax=Amycolatopsis anabasis TaxID=1840409 RepID=UPI00131B3205|nr:trypsin-like serine protease [Amycolatopsis anabasis]
MWRKVGGLAAALLVAVTLAFAGPANAIVGGIPATEEYAFAGSVQLEHKGDPRWHSCGVTLITAWHALGSAHCHTNDEPGGSKTFRYDGHEGNRSDVAAEGPPIDWENPALFRVVFGSHDRHHGTEERRVARISKSPLWNKLKPGAVKGDLLLLTFDRLITTIRPAGLAMVDPRRPVREIGWGLHSVDDLGKGPVPRYLHEADAPGAVPTSRDCRGAEIGVDEICVLKGRDVNDRRKRSGYCFGDSGAGALQRGWDGWWYLVGTVSRGPDGPHGEPRCATDAVLSNPMFPGHTTWILGAIAQQAGASVRVAGLPETGAPGATHPAVLPDAA